MPESNAAENYEYGNDYNQNQPPPSKKGRLIDPNENSPKREGQTKKTPDEHYRKLQADRVRDSKQQMRQSADRSRSDQGARSRNKPRARRSKAQKALDVKREVDLAKELPFAFTAIDPSEDFIHWLIIGISILADVLTIVPWVGSIIAIPFIVAAWFFYLLNGHFKKSPVRKIATTGIFQFAEIILSTLPALTASALINYWYALADKKLTARESQKARKTR